MNFYTISHLRGFDFMQNTHSIFPVILLCMKSFWKMLQFDCIINACRFLPLSTSTQFLWLMRNWSSFVNWKWKSKTRQFLFLNFVLKLTIPLPYCQSVLTQMLLDLEALSVCMFVPSKKNKAMYHWKRTYRPFSKTLYILCFTDDFWYQISSSRQILPEP